HDHDIDAGNAHCRPASRIRPLLPTRVVRGSGRGIRVRTGPARTSAGTDAPPPRDLTPCAGTGSAVMPPGGAMPSSPIGPAAGASLAPVRVAASPPRRRRPSGEPPPLLHRINVSGFFWLGLVVVVAGIWVALALSTTARTALDIADNAALQRLVDLRTRRLTRLIKVLGAPAPANALQRLWATHPVGLRSVRP